MKGLCRIALAVLFLAACGGESAVTGLDDPMVPNAPSSGGGILAIGVDSVTGASIETNKDDYVPGEVVHLVGRGWAAGETVNLHMTEEPNTHADVDTNVVADAAGGYSIHFYDVQSHDWGVQFTLTATGLTSGSRAVATFTDGREITSATINTVMAVTVAPSAMLTANVIGSLTGNAQNTLGSIGVRAYVDGSLPATAVPLGCYNVHPNQGPSAPSTPIPFNHTFTFTGPSGTNVYDVIFTSYSDDACAVNSGAFPFTMQNAITVQNPNTAPTLDPIGNQTVNEGSALNFTATASDTDSPAQTLTFSLIGAPAGATIGSSSGSFSWTPTDGPAQSTSFTVRVTDNGSPLKFAEQTVNVTVSNVAPTATFNAPASVSAGSNINLSFSAPNDVSSNDVSAEFTYDFDCGLGAGYDGFAAGTTQVCSTTTPGSRTVKGKIRDKDGGETEYEKSVAIDNVPPTADAGESYSGNEGSPINISGSGSDPDGGAVSFLWTVSDPVKCSFADATLAATTVTCADNGAYTLTLKVTDNENAFTTDNATLTVANVAPTATFAAQSPVNEGSSFNLSLTNPFDPSTADVAAGLEYAFDCGDGGGYGAFGAATSRSCPTTDNGTRSVGAKIKDKDNGVSTYTGSVTVNNVAPTATFAAQSPVNEGSSFNLSLTGPFDPSSDDVAAGLEYAFDCGDGSGYGAFGAATSRSCPTTDNGTRSVGAKIKDKDNGVSTYTSSVTVNNVAPTATFAAQSPVNEGSSFNLSLTGPFDPSSDDVAAGLEYAFDCGDGSGYGAFGATTSRSCPTTDNGTRSVGAKIKDKDNGVSTYTGSVTVNNVAPTLSGVTGSVTPVALGVSTSITLAFSDPANSYDTYTASVNWDDGNGYVGGGTVTPGVAVSKTFSQAGVYTVCAKVSDEDGGTSEEKCYAYIVVYDPSGGFVTGGGWINSPAGAYVADPNLAGKANFGFTSKYLPGRNVPSGNTEFQFHAGNLNFKSTVYEWLVVGGTRAQFKGDGTINGVAGYGFLLTAIDETQDKFRIKIVLKTTGAVVYDNQMGELDDSPAATIIGGGSIVVHTKK